MEKEIESQRELIAQKKQRLEKKEKLLKEKERKLRTKKLIELGSLIEKAGLDKLHGTALFGALLEMRENSKNQQLVDTWHQKGKASIKSPSSASSTPLAISFHHHPPEDILKLLRSKSFKWNRFRKEWYGYGNKVELTKVLATASPKIEVLS